MYHLTPIQAMIVVALFAIIFLTKSAKKSIDGTDSTLASLYPEFKDAAKCGYGYLYCKEMKKRDMIFKGGRWVPKEKDVDINSKEFRETMLKKDLILDRLNEWEFTGKTREKLFNAKALPWQKKENKIPRKFLANPSGCVRDWPQHEKAPDASRTEGSKIVLLYLFHVHHENKSIQYSILHFTGNTL